MLNIFRKILKSKKAQSTAEYAIMIALVIGAVVAMQTYVKRGLQGRLFDAVTYLANAGSNVLVGGRQNSTLQYEPDYMASNFTTTKSDDMSFIMDNETTRQSGSTNTSRGGSQNVTWNGQRQTLGAAPSATTP